MDVFFSVLLSKLLSFKSMFKNLSTICHFPLKQGIYFKEIVGFMVKKKIWKKITIYT